MVIVTVEACRQCHAITVGNCQGLPFQCQRLGNAHTRLTLRTLFALGSLQCSEEFLFGTFIACIQPNLVSGKTVVTRFALRALLALGSLQCSEEFLFGTFIACIQPNLVGGKTVVTRFALRTLFSGFTLRTLFSLGTLQ